MYKRQGKGEALRATRDLLKGERLLRVAPLAAVPYAAELTRLCGGCFQPVGEVCSSCRSARLCARCGAGAAGTLHAYECHALTRLRDGEEGLSLAHSDLRLLLRALAVRRRALDAAADGDASDDDSDDEDDPAAAAAAEDGDVIVDGYDSLEGLMSGMDGGDDGELPTPRWPPSRRLPSNANFSSPPRAGRRSMNARGCSGAYNSTGSR